jgi:hypothetical protein
MVAILKWLAPLNFRFCQWPFYKSVFILMPEIPYLIKRKYIGDFFPEETVTFLGKQGIM